MPDVGMRKALGSVTQFLRPQMNYSPSNPVGTPLPPGLSMLIHHGPEAMSTGAEGPVLVLAMTLME